MPAIATTSTAEIPQPVVRASLWAAPVYQPRELHQSARTGAQDASQLPSRMNNRLHWPDGHVTPVTSTPTGEIQHG